MPATPFIQIDSKRYDAVIFDMDGVITDTAEIHAEAWKRLFDDFLREHAEETGTAFEPFDVGRDYLRYVDGKAREDGVRSFLASRGIDLPEGVQADSAEARTIHGLGTRKNSYFLRTLDEEGAVAFPEAVALVRALREAGVGTAVISASRNASRVLESAGVTGLFDAQVDGEVAAELGLPGKPDPAVFLEAARRLGAKPERAAVIEDAEAGVAAGAAGGFDLVIGVDHANRPERLLENGADVVVSDLREVAVVQGATPMAELSSALERWDEAAARIGGRTPAVFLDYDGTLTPIVERPEDALLDAEMRERIRRLARTCLVGIVSGRDVAFVLEQVAVDEALYLGSHGFDIVVPEGREIRQERAGEFERFLDPLAEAEERLAQGVAGVAGARIERKKYAIAVHYRQVDDAQVAEVERAVDEELARQPLLRKTGGKKVFELRPDIDWDKGRAVQWVLDSLGMTDESYAPVYIGDDLTDEDAFSVVRGRGLAIVVGSDERPTMAEYRVPETEDVGLVLERIHETAKGGAK